MINKLLPNHKSFFIIYNLENNNINNFLGNEGIQKLKWIRRIYHNYEKLNTTLMKKFRVYLHLLILSNVSNIRINGTGIH